MRTTMKNWATIGLIALLSTAALKGCEPKPAQADRPSHGDAVYWVDKRAVIHFKTLEGHDCYMAHNASGRYYDSVLSLSCIAGTK